MHYLIVRCPHSFNDNFPEEDNDDDGKSFSSCLADLTSTCPELEGTLLKKTKKYLVRFLIMMIVTGVSILRYFRKNLLIKNSHF